MNTALSQNILLLSLPFLAYILPWNISGLLFNFSETRTISYFSFNPPPCLAQFLIKTNKQTNNPMEQWKHWSENCGSYLHFFNFLVLSSMPSPQHTVIIFAFTIPETQILLVLTFFLFSCTSSF